MCVCLCVSLKERKIKGENGMLCECYVVKERTEEDFFSA